MANQNTTAFLHVTDSVEDIVTESEGRVVPGLDYTNIMYILIGVFGILSNSFVILVITKSKAMRKGLTNKMIVNQSAIDISASILMVAEANVRFDTSGLSGLSDSLYCKLWISKVFLWSLFCASTYNLVIISIERYYEIVHPIQHKSFLTRTKTILLLLFPWIIPVIIEILYVIPTTGIVQGYCVVIGIFPSELAGRICVIFVNVFQLIFPLGVMIVSYTHIYLTLRKRITPASTLSEAERSREKRMVKASMNVLKTMVTVCVCFFLCWVWDEIIITVYTFGGASDMFTGNSPVGKSNIIRDLIPS